MVKRYMFDVDGCDCCDLITYHDQHGLWVRHRDYAKLADLCGRMAEMLKCVPDNGSEYAKVCKEAIAEWKDIR